MKLHVLDDVSQQNVTVTDDVKVLTVNVEAKAPAVTVDMDFITLMAIIGSILGLVIFV